MPDRRKDAAIKPSLFRLSHFHPHLKDSCGNQFLDYIVLDSLVCAGPLLFLSADEIKSDIKKRYLIDVEEAEIDASANRLSDKELIAVEKHGLAREGRIIKAKYKPSPEICNKIDKNLEAINQLEKEVFEEWRVELTQKYKNHTYIGNSIDRIEKKLQLFINRMFHIHGVECTALLYPESRKAQRWLDEVGYDILYILPKLEKLLDDVANIEILLFFREKNLKRIRYINNLFNSSFLWHVIQVDEKCSRMLSGLTKGQALFLDNNILYSLVGLDGIELLNSVHSMLQIAKNLSYELFVTTKTIEEFKESIRRNIKKIKPIPRELARIASESIICDEFIKSYWSQYASSGVSIEEFISEKSHVDNILEGLGVKIYDKYRAEIEESDHLLDEESILRGLVPYVDDHIITHDAFHRLLILKIRDGDKYSFSEAKAWFLSEDTKLPAYDKIARKGREILPFCLLISQWVQINRPFLPRTISDDERDKSYHALVTQPFLRAMLSILPLEKAYNEVLGRLSRLKNNPQLALKIVTDTHFLLSISSETDPGKIDNEIDNKLVDIAQQVELENIQLAKEVDKKDKTITKLTDNLLQHKKETENKFDEYERKLEELTRTVEVKEERGRILTQRLNIYSTLFIIILIGVVYFFGLGALLYFSHKYASGENLWQKIISSKWFFGLWTALTFFLGKYFVGKDRTSALLIVWKNMFKKHDR